MPRVSTTGPQGRPETSPGEKEGGETCNDPNRISQQGTNVARWTSHGVFRGRVTGILIRSLSGGGEAGRSGAGQFTSWIKARGALSCAKAMSFCSSCTNFSLSDIRWLSITLR